MQNKKHNKKYNKQNTNVSQSTAKDYFHLEKPSTFADLLTKVVITEKAHGDTIKQLAEFPLEVEQVIFKPIKK